MIIGRRIVDEYSMAGIYMEQVEQGRNAAGSGLMTLISLRRNNHRNMA